MGFSWDSGIVEYRTTPMAKVLILLLVLCLTPNILWAQTSVDDLPNITGGVIPLLTFEVSGGGQLFSSGHLTSRGEMIYLVRVKNQSGDPIKADSLVVVVEHIQDLRRLRDVTNKVEFPGADGETRTGKPFYRVPMGEKTVLGPYQESQSFSLEIRNPNLIQLYPPVLRVRGIRVTAAQRYQEALSGMEHTQ